MQTRRRLKMFAACMALVMLALFAVSGCSQNTPPDDATTPSFSHQSGVYEARSIDVTLTAPKGSTIAYTTDGRVPTADDDTGKALVRVRLRSDEAGYLVQHADLMGFSEVVEMRLYESASLPDERVLRAALVNESGEIGEVVTRAYLLDVDLAKRFPNCLVISIVTDPANLLDYDTGIMALGAAYDEWAESEEAAASAETGAWWDIKGNFSQHGKEWERPCLMQIYETGSTTPTVEVGAGIRITGNVSRTIAQKSFNFYFRDEYGAKWLDYELFDGTERYRNFRMRAGGNNAMWLKFKDAYLMELLQDRACLAAQSRPAVLFINGEYWGPYLLSEKVNAQMIADHTGADKDQVVIMKEGEVDEGADEDIALYEELMAFADRDLADSDVWQEFCDMMDVQSFADYAAARIYVGDADWSPVKNDILWRSRDDSYNGGRWQYVLYDIEYSTGLYGDPLDSYETDHFRKALEDYPLFAAAMRNAEFRELFTEALVEIGSVDCSVEHTEDVLAGYLDTWNPLMSDYYARFGDRKVYWDDALKDMRRFFNNRYDYIVPIVQEWRPE